MNVFFFYEYNTSVSSNSVNAFTEFKHALDHNNRDLRFTSVHYIITRTATDSYPPRTAERSK